MIRKLFTLVLLLVLYSTTAVAASVPNPVTSVWYITRAYNPDRTIFAVALDWYASKNAQWYHVERKLDDGSFERVATEITETAYAEEITQTGNFTYRVIAGNDVGLAESWTQSPPVDVRIYGYSGELEIPQGLQASEVSGLRVQLDWDPLSNPGAHTGIRVFEKMLDEDNPFGGISYLELSDLAATSSSVVLTTDGNGMPFAEATSYTFVVKSMDGDNLSHFSDEASITMSGSGAPHYTITATAGPGGVIAPSGSVSVPEGFDQTFTVTPALDFEIDTVTVDGQPVELETGVGVFGEILQQYTVEAVSSNHTIYATFQPFGANADPGRPSVLYVHQAGAGYLDLRFMPSVSVEGGGIARYHVYRSDSQTKSKSEIGTTTTTSFIDTGVSVGQTVFYSIVAEDNVGEFSPESETLGLVIPGTDNEAPGEPVGLSATLNGGESLSVDLAWKLAADNGSGVSVYEIFRQSGAPDEADTPYAVSRDTRFTDTDITNGQQVTYWVRTRDLSGNSSVPVSISVTAPLSGLEPIDYFAYFPHLATGANWWTGFALSNTSGMPANIEIQFFGSDGTLLTTLTDPVTLAAGQKILTTIAALFDNNVPEGASWWRVLSDQPLNGFELFGRPSNDRTTEEMVGVKIARGASERLLFPIVTVSETNWTGIALVNTSEGGTATVTFTAYDAGGTALATSDPVTVPAFGKTVKLAESYFGDGLPAGATTMIMESDRPCIGFELYGYKDHTGLAGVSAVALATEADEKAAVSGRTNGKAAGMPYRYRVSRTITAADQQARYQLTNTGDAAVDLDVVTTYTGSQQTAPYSIPAMGSLELAIEADGVYGIPVSTGLNATGPLTVTETFEDPTVGYFDSLFGMSDGSGTNPVTHIATSTGYWDTDLFLWNPSPYFNQLTMTVLGPDGTMLDLSASGLSNPFNLTLDPFGSWEGEIHELIASDGNVKQIGWIQVEGQFSFNGYFTFGTKDGRKISAVELE